MTYKQYLKGNLDGFRQMNDLQVADLGACEDRHIWLCYHHQEGERNVLAIEGRNDKYGTFYDIIADPILASASIGFADGVPYVKNLDDFYDLAKQVANDIYELDNDKYENTQAHSDECA